MKPEIPMAKATGMPSNRKTPKAIKIVNIVPPD
jgi:hypothetical protein